MRVALVLACLLVVGRIAAGEQELDTLDIDAVALEYTCPSTDEIVRDLEVQVSTLKGTIQVLEERLVSQAERDGTELKKLRQKLATAAKIVQTRNKDIEAKDGEAAACRTELASCSSRSGKDRKASEEALERLHKAAAACRLRLTDASASRVEAERRAERLEARLRESEADAQGVRQRLSERQTAAARCDALAQQLAQESAAREAAALAAADAKAALLAALDAAAARERLVQLERAHEGELLPHWLAVWVSGARRESGARVAEWRERAERVINEVVDGARAAHERHVAPRLRSAEMVLRLWWRRADAAMASHDSLGAAWQSARRTLDAQLVKLKAQVTATAARLTRGAQSYHQTATTMLWRLSNSPRLPAWAQSRLSHSACSALVSAIGALIAFLLAALALSGAALVARRWILPARLSAAAPPHLADLEDVLGRAFRRPETLARVLASLGARPAKASPDALGRAAVDFLRLRRGSAAEAALPSGPGSSGSAAALARFAASEAVERDLRDLQQRVGPLVVRCGPGRKVRRHLRALQHRATLAVLGAILLDSDYDLSAVGSALQRPASAADSAREAAARAELNGSSTPGAATPEETADSGTRGSAAGYASSESSASGGAAEGEANSYAAHDECSNDEGEQRSDDEEE